MKHTLVGMLFVLFSIVGCTSDAPSPDTPAVYDPTLYSFDAQGLPVPPLPTDYPLTNQRVLLGRMLFHDGLLSRDGRQSCASCHVQKDGFSDIRQFSIGVKGLPGGRQAMPVANLAWHRRGFFWDGRAPTLRDQALRPIQDTLEMDETLPNVVSKLTASKTYRDQFIRAFNTDTITSALVGIALEQFMFTLVSGNSKFDLVARGQASFTPSEERGRVLFNTEFDPTGKVKGAECFHCHAAPLFTNDRFMNNGLDNDASFTDKGREKVTGLLSDRAKFKVPTLRNIAVTHPYMHDGRFATLEQVVDHYSTGVNQSSTMDPLLQYNLPPGLGLTQQDKDDLVAFLKTLTDQTFLSL
ncbi:MAG: cytochrome-c peroxidase [Candidatus Kapabacteria bacterium]|nr:cytochrome-c peroxidase [Candidatus Kapabacteria bacterium]